MSRIVVVGDCLLDEDVDGPSTRLAPDAPVPVVEDAATRCRAGGAGLAARLAAADGHDVVLVTGLAADAGGAALRGLLAGHARVEALAAAGETPVKTRVHAAGRPLARLDRGRLGRLGEVPSGVLAAVAAADAVLVSDYGHGVAAHPQLRAALAGAARRGTVVWDPHPRGGEPLPGCVVTPNDAEAARVAGDVAGSGLRAAQLRAEAVLRAWRARAVALTLGARGALLCYGEGAPLVAPARRLERVDPCGAGDRFASRLAGALAGGAVLSEAVLDAVEAATDFLAGGGVAALTDAPAGRPAARAVPDAADVVARNPAVPEAADVVARTRAAGGTVVGSGGCFDLLHVGHVATLEAARRLGDCLVVLINSDDSVRRLKGPERPLVGQDERAAVLQALACVDAVAVFDEDTPVAALARLRPDVWVKGGDYGGQVLPEQAAVEAWGGQVVALPYLDGHSTTALVHAVRGDGHGNGRSRT